MEDIGGVSLGEYVAAGAAYGRPFSHGQLLNFTNQLLDIVGALHEQGVVHRDLKATNILVTEEGILRLIDFEHAAWVGEIPKTGGTRGYVSPQQRAGRAADLRDDIYAIGALLLLMSTGAEPSRAPNPANLLTRPLRLINPDIPLRLTSVIASCLHPDDSLRLPDTAGVRAALANLADHCHRGPETIPEPQAPTDSLRVSSRSSEPPPEKRAEQLADALCARAVSEGGLVTWISTAPHTLPVPYRQINNGVAGILIALAAGWTAFGQARHRDTLVRGARWLARSEELPGAKVSGLYTGEAGVGAALLHAGCALNYDEFVAAAFNCARRLRDHPFASADLFHGTAGRLRFLLMLYEREREVSVLADALDCAEDLHRRAIRLDTGTAHWATVDFSGDLLEVASYAHGTSGIADALLDLFEVNGDPVHLNLALQAAQWVREQSVTTLVDGSGLDWGKGGAFSGLWCYGASGVGILFTHLARLGVDASAEDVAVRAAFSAARASRAAAPGLCHGLGGPIDYLLDMYQLTLDLAWFDEAGQLAKLLDAFHADHPAGYPAFAEDDSDISYMLGDAGVAVTLLRLADKGITPRPLTLPAIRRLIAIAQDT